MDRAADIRDLEKMLNDGEGDEDLCDRAIEIFERLRDEVKRHRFSGDTLQKDRIKEEARDFADVIEQIEQRRHEHTLDKFKEYLMRQPV